MNSILSKILIEKEKEVTRLKQVLGDKSHSSLEQLREEIFLSTPPIARNFKRSISKRYGISLIAEIKFASPSMGIIREKVDPVTIGKIYEESGVSAISYITDTKFFGGSINLLSNLKKSVSLPILRKDFIIDEVQVIESWLYGADALLLIARILSRNRLRALLKTCQEFGLTALTEIHNEVELYKAIDCGAKIIGINNRNLDTFQVDIDTTLMLSPMVPKEKILVSESGIEKKQDIQILKKAGVHAVLVGTSIMGSNDIKKKIKELINA